MRARCSPAYGLLALLFGCGVSDDCVPGERGCSCTPRATCDTGLSCQANVCIQHIAPGTAPSPSALTDSTPVVGAECTTDAQCGASLRCITSGSSELTGGGPAAGYCTRACTADAECQALDTRSVCGSTGGVSVCLRGCLSGEPTPTENKCLNRSTLVCDAPPRTLGEREPGVCVPQCASDVDCPGRACDLASGLCSDRASSGLAIGAPCTSDSQCAARDCQGVCTARCSAGRQNNGCGFGIRASLRAAACVLAPSGSFGDVGLCLEVCDVDADCTEPAATCSPGVFNTGRSGFCAPPSGSAQ